MGGLPRRLLGERAMARRKRAIKRGGQRPLRRVGEVGGAQGDDRRVGGGQGGGEPVERAALAAAGRGEQADREGGRGVGPAQQVGEPFEQFLCLRRE